jgi:hypothetical protein
VGKIKNTEGSAMSVGSVTVQLKYGLYVGHLSKWFVFVFKFWTVCRLVNGRPTIGYNVLALGEEADFEALNCQSSTNVDTRQNVQLTTEPAFLPNACYQLGFLSVVLSS